MVVHGASGMEPAAVAKMDKPRGVFGLVNNGSMCWFNSLIQVMLSLPNFIIMVRRCAADGSPIMAALDKFLAAAEAAPGPWMNAMSILTELMRACPGFGGQQEDAAEGLVLMLDKLHPDVSRLFEATYRIDIYCDTCRATVGDPRQDSMTVIPMERNFITVGTTGDPLAQYLSGHMTRMDDWKCPKCCNVASSTRPVMRIARLVKCPEILAVSFNKYDGKWSGSGAGPGMYGQDIELQCGTAAERTGPVSYSLTGIIRHFGGRDSGHYNAVCRRPLGVWIFDDMAVAPGVFQAGDADYMLIYSRMAAAEKIENRAP